MLINLSNHPLSTWSEKQIQAAKLYGKIVDLPFPEVDPEADENYILNLCQNYTNKVLKIIDSEAPGLNSAVHVMGELTLTSALVNSLQKRGVVCIASTTKRNALYLGKGKKETAFVFERFRNYI